MSGQPWETHDPLCPNRRPTIAFPNSACSGCRAVVAARAEGYARGLIEGDHGGRREGYRSGYAAGKDAVMTASYAQAVAEGQRDERERIRAGVTGLFLWPIEEGIVGRILAVIDGGKSSAPVPMTQEEKIAFREKWDAKYMEGKRHD